MNTTVYIPDALGERVRRYRDKLKLSSIFQKAVMRKIDLLENEELLAAGGYWRIRGINW